MYCRALLASHIDSMNPMMKDPMIKNRAPI